MRRSSSDTSTVSFETFDLAQQLDAVHRVYEAAFQRIAPERRAVFERHAAKAGHLGVAAVNADGAMVGMAYGYLAHAGDWWSDMVRPHLADAGELAAISDAFAIAEVAVLPAYQGHGIGGRIVDDLLRRIDARHALLGVYTDNAVARHVYEKRGFAVLTAPFRFFAGDRPYVVMGTAL